MLKTATQIPHFRQSSQSLSRTDRLGLFLLGILLLALLGVASWLNPDPTGMGTHLQLGLPNCTMNAFLGIPCPGCGMTTAWAHTLNGDLAKGVECNAAGVLLCLLAAGLAPCAFVLALRGKASTYHWVSTVAITTLLAVVAISAVQWMIRLAFA
jgi:Protein of unknown function (DUF2752)